MPPRAEPFEENEKTKHARLPAQMPASRVSKNPCGNDRQEQMDAVSRLTDGNIEQTDAWARQKRKRAIRHGIQKHVAQQREGPSGQPLAEFATLPSAVVKIARAYGQRAICRHNRESANTREKQRRS